MSKWVKRDRRYRKGYRLTGHAWRMMLGWGTFVVIWLLLGSLYGWPGLLGLLAVIAYGGLSAARGASRRAVTRATPPVTYLPPPAAPLGQRNTRSIPQPVKIAVAARDGGSGARAAPTQSRTSSCSAVPATGARELTTFRSRRGCPQTL